MNQASSSESPSSPQQRATHSGILRSLKWLIAAAVLVCLAYLAFAPKAVECDLGTVMHGPMEITIEAEGETRVRERYLITSPLPGRVLRIDLEPGDFVQEDDHLATIIPEVSRLLDPRTRAQAQAMVSAAEAALTRAEEQVELAGVEFETAEKAHRRNTELHQSGSVSEAALENSERSFLTAGHSLHAAESGVEMAWFELEQARAALLHAQRETPATGPLPSLGDPEFAPQTAARTLPAAGTVRDAPQDPEQEWGFIIQSPIEGQVLRVPEKSGRSIQPGTKLLEIGDPRELEIAIEVLSQDAVKVAPGQPVRIEHWGGTRPLTGHVRHVEPSAFTEVSALGVDEQRVRVIVDFEPPAASEGEFLGDGFRTEAHIVVWKKDDVLQVPTAALFRREGKWVVFRVDQASGRARVTPVNIDHHNGDSAEVLSGLTPGDRVILHPGGNITEAMRIEERQ